MGAHLIVRALDSVGDWTFGKGQNDYKSNIDAVTQNISTRLKSFLGDCFFATTAGIDWFNFLGGKDQIALNLAINATILNTTNVTGILQTSINLDEVTRVFSVAYNAQTSFGPVGDLFQYDVNAFV